ncbi:MAG: hypothetical protein HZC28_05965 [Spirochaetes bacterium]|nr:hypothetical protein [Spirochaetota bacterium]
MNKSVLLSVIGYIPVAGWFFPLYLSDEHDGFARFHAKQSVIVSGYLLGSILLYLLLSLMLPPGLSTLLLIVLIANICAVLYYSGVAVHRIITKNEKYMMPFVDRVFDRFPL